MMKQSSWNMHEDRFFVNIGAKSSVININFHGDTPYHVKTSQPGKRGIELQFWTDPSCPEPLSLDLHVDLYGSLGRVLIRYRMVVLVFTYMVVILTIQSQLCNWNQGGSFQSFGNTLRQLITSSRSWNFSAALAFMAFSQSLLPTAYVEIGSNQQETDAWPSWTSDWCNGILRDVPLGRTDTFWFLAPVFFQMAVGITVLIWLVLNTLVRLLAGVLALIMRSSRARDSGVLTPQRYVAKIYLLDHRVCLFESLTTLVFVSATNPNLVVPRAWLSRYSCSLHSLR